MRYGEPIRLDNPTDSRAIILGMVPDGVDVLELGCSVGYMTKVMHERGSRIVGVEIDPEAARHAEPYLERVIVGDLDLEPLVDDLPPASFDVVLAADVLEHLRDPAACLRSLIRLLRPDGAIVISVPNVAHVDVRLELLDGRFRYRDNGLLDRTHLKMFTLEALTELLDTVALVPVTWRPNRRPLATTEIAVDAHAREFGERVVAADPEADVYQWIVVCRPAGTGVAAVAPDLGSNRIGSLLDELTRPVPPSTPPAGRTLEQIGTAELARTVAHRIVTGVPRRLGRLLGRFGTAR
jgi:SAM-dependent methyltransferase